MLPARLSSTPGRGTRTGALPRRGVPAMRYRRHAGAAQGHRPHDGGQAAGGEPLAPW